MAPEPGPPSKASGRNVFVVLLKLALTAVVTVFIVRRVGVDLDALGGLELARWRWSPLPLAGSVLALAAGYAFSASLWGRMVKELGGPRLPSRECLPLFLVANLGRYVPGKVLQIAGLTLLARERGVPPGVAAGAAVLGQGVALMGATLVGISAFLSPALPGAVRLGGWVALAVTWAFVLATSLPLLARRLEGAWRRLVLRRFPSLGAAEAPEAPSPSPAPAAPPPLPTLRRSFGIRWTAWYAANWGLYATAFWLLFMGLEGFAPFLYVAPAFAAAYVGGYLALFAPAGLGIREGLLVVFLAPVIPAEPALALAVVARVWTTVVEVVPAALMAPSVLRGRLAPPTEVASSGPSTISPGEDRR